MKKNKKLSKNNINFNKKNFIKAFSKISKGRNGNPQADWNMIIAYPVDSTTEENLARLVWKGIQAQTEEYLKKVDELL